MARVSKEYIKSASSGHLTGARAEAGAKTGTDVGLGAGAYDAEGERKLGLGALAATGATYATYPVVLKNLEYADPWFTLADTATGLTKASDIYGTAKNIHALASSPGPGEGEEYDRNVHGDVWAETADLGNLAEEAMSASMYFNPITMPFWVWNELTRKEEEGKEFGTLPFVKGLRGKMNEWGETISETAPVEWVSERGRDIHEYIVDPIMGTSAGEFFLDLARLPFGAVEGAAGIVGSTAKKVDEKVFRGWLPGGSSPTEVREGGLPDIPLTDSWKGAATAGWLEPLKAVTKWFTGAKTESDFPDEPSALPTVAGSPEELDLKKIMENFGTFTEDTEGMPEEAPYKETGYTVGEMKAGFNTEVNELVEDIKAGTPTPTSSSAGLAWTLEEKFKKSEEYWNQLEDVDKAEADLDRVANYDELDYLAQEIRKAQEENTYLNDLDDYIEQTEARLDKEVNDYRKTMMDVSSFRESYQKNSPMVFTDNREWWEKQKANPSDQINKATVMVDTYKVGPQISYWSEWNPSSDGGYFGHPDRALVFDEERGWVQVPETPIFHNWVLEELEKHSAGQPNAIADWVESHPWVTGAHNSRLRSHYRKDLWKHVNSYANYSEWTVLGSGWFNDNISEYKYIYGELVNTMNHLAMASPFMKDLSARIPAMSEVADTISPGLTDFRSASSNRLTPDQVVFLSGYEDSQWLFEALEETGQASLYFDTFLENWDSELGGLTPYGKELFDVEKQLSGSQQLMQLAKGVFGTDFTVSTETYYNHLLDGGLSEEEATRILADATGTSIETLYNSDGSIKGDLITWTEIKDTPGHETSGGGRKPELIPEGTFAGFDEEGRAVSTDSEDWNPEDAKDWKRIVKPPPDFKHDPVRLAEALPPGGWPDVMYKDPEKTKMLVYMGGRKFAGSDKTEGEGTYYDPVKDEKVYIPPEEVRLHFGEGDTSASAGVQGHFTQTEYAHPGYTDPFIYTGPPLRNEVGFTVQDELKGIVPENRMDARPEAQQYYENPIDVALEISAFNAQNASFNNPNFGFTAPNVIDYSGIQADLGGGTGHTMMPESSGGGWGFSEMRF